MATPVTVQVATLVSTVSTGERLRTKMWEDPVRTSRVTETSWMLFISSHSQDGPAMPSGLVGKPNLRPLQLRCSQGL